MTKKKQVQALVVCFEPW